jgi:hypothetical protein
MAGVYRPRHPARTVLYRVLFHHFERFVAEYEERFEKAYGYFRSIVKAVVEKYLDCGINHLMFRTVRITLKNYCATIDDEDRFLTVAPFYFEWNKPFKSLWEIGFIQGMAEATAEEKGRELASQEAKKKEWRGRRDLNSRPLT